MCKTILFNRFIRISTFLLSLLLLISFTTGSLFADSGSKPKVNNGAMQRIRAHMQIVRQGNPEIDQVVKKTERQLLNGVISPKQSCYNCHTNYDTIP